MKKIDKDLYKDKVSKNEKSPVVKDVIWAYAVGGLICCLGQAISDIAMNMGADKELGGTLASISLIFLSCLFTGLGLFGKLAKKAGAGTAVPITGFANAVSSAAIEFKNEGFIFGVGAKLFTVAGPVIVYGIVSSVIGGIIYYFFAM